MNSTKVSTRTSPILYKKTFEILKTSPLSVAEMF